MGPTDGRDSKLGSPFSITVLGVCLGLVLIVPYLPETQSIKLEATANSGEPIQIPPGPSDSRELAGGASEVFGVAVTKDQLLRFSIDKGDLALSTTLYGPTGRKLLEHVSQDFEIVDLSFPAQLAGTYKIELRSQESDKTPRPYELKVQPLSPVTPINRKDSEARQAIAHGEMLRAKYVANSFRQATEQFDKATVIWESIADFANAARAALKAGDTCFVISEYQEASKRYQNAEALAEKAGDWLAKAMALSQVGRTQSFMGNNDAAQKQLAQSLSLFKQNEDSRNLIASSAHGEALTNLAEVSYSVGNFAKSLDQLESAAGVFQNYRKGEARVHLLVGQITGSMGETQRAVAELTLARDLYQSINEKNGEMLVLTTLELAHAGEGKENRLIQVRLDALDVFRLTGNRQSETAALNGLGTSYEELREYKIAIDHYKKALELAQAIGSVDAATASALQLGVVYGAIEKPEQSLAYYELCLKLAQSAGNARDEVNALKDLAPIYAQRGLHDRAAEHFQTALKFYESSGDLRGQSMVLDSYGDFRLQRGEKLEALDLYSRAFAFSEKVDEPEILITALYNLADVYLELGSPEAALPFIQRSLNIIEGVRASVETPDFRVSYFSGVQEHYELCIHVLMQLEKLKPGRGFAAEALAVSERARARLLVDLVTQVRSTPRSGVADELLERERRLSGLLRNQAEYRMSLSSNQTAELAEVDDEVVQLKIQHQEVLARLSEQQPHLFSLEQAPPVDLQRIQNELRGGDTMLLEYSLGKTSSYLWAVTADSIRFYELPAGEAIEEAAREYYQLMIVRQGTDGQTAKDYRSSIDKADKLLPEKAKKLSEILFGPLAGQLGTRRLLVVADGSLQYVPFDTLPLPGAEDGTLLVNTNEIVVEPSFSTLVAIRAKQNRSRSTKKLIAVITDPVSSGSDDRVPISANSSETSRLKRLIHASEEADAIIEVAPQGTTMVAKGFDASREVAMSSDVAQYQIVHFATHAFADEQNPELSSVVLTMVDRNGQKADGLMLLHDVYSLDLAAELTVLSACQTALGKDTKGEGVVGLTHGFISAGSKTVVASLWKVDDRATSVLMAHFYDAMLQQGISPAAALRAAKLKMMRDPQWSAPYYWAGFVVQGEYENHIVLNDHSSLRFGLILLFLLGLIAAGLIVLQRRKQRFSHRAE